MKYTTVNLEYPGGEVVPVRAGVLYTMVGTTVVLVKDPRTGASRVLYLKDDKILT